MIKKIIRTVDGISPKQAKKILHSATNAYPLDRNLLLDINEVIIKNGLTDLSQIGEDLLIPFKTLDDFHENTTSRMPNLQSVTRPAVARKIQNISIPGIKKKVIDLRKLPIPEQQPRNDKSRFEYNQTNKSDHKFNMKKSRQRERRNCDFRTGRITTSYDSAGSSDSDERYIDSGPTQMIYRQIDNSNPSIPTSPLSSCTSSVCSDNQYVPQQVFLATR